MFRKIENGNAVFGRRISLAIASTSESGAARAARIDTLYAAIHSAPDDATRARAIDAYNVAVNS